VTARLELRDARVGYGRIDVLHDLTLVFPRGHVVALLGRNGAGKSSVLGALSGTLALRAGHVLLDGVDISRATPLARARRGITVVPDDPNVYGALTVEEHLSLFAAGRSFDAGYDAFPELRPRRAQRAATLSGGERQMLALSRLVLRSSPVILLDEVSRGLAPAAAARLYEVIAGLRTSDRTIVAVEQHRDELLAISDLVYVLRRGELQWAGLPRELAAVARG